VEALYNWIGSVFDAAAKDPDIKRTLKESAVEAEREMITPLFQWRYNGRPAGNSINNAEGAPTISTDLAPPNKHFDNRPEETKYIYTDGEGQPLEGRNAYTITFAKGETPPVRGFWSLQRGALLPPERPQSRFVGHEERDTQTRAYWADQAILDGQWKPPVVSKTQ
jgi:hypothetical protein